MPGRVEDRDVQFAKADFKDRRQHRLLEAQPGATLGAKFARERLECLADEPVSAADERAREGRVAQEGKRNEWSAEQE